MLGHLDERLGRIGEARDPVRAAGTGHVAVTVDEPGNDRRAGRIDDGGVAWVVLPVGRADPGDPPADHEEAHAPAQGWLDTVGERGAAVQDRCRRHSQATRTEPTPPWIAMSVRCAAVS